MIFSKDKKPTEPGKYWIRYMDTVTIVEVFAAGLYGKPENTLWWDRRDCYPVDANVVEWGDRIDTPTVTVEAAPETGKKGGDSE